MLTNQSIDHSGFDFSWKVNYNFFTVYGSSICILLLPNIQRFESLQFQFKNKSQYHYICILTGTEHNKLKETQIHMTNFQNPGHWTVDTGNPGPMI